MKNPTRFLAILAALVNENDARQLRLSDKELARLAHRQYSREAQSVPASLGGTLPYNDPTGNAGVARAMRRNRKRVAA